MANGLNFEFIDPSDAMNNFRHQMKFMKPVDSNPWKGLWIIKQTDMRNGVGKCFYSDKISNLSKAQIFR